MKEYIISGIQQVGIGVPDVEEAWAWLRTYFGMDVPIFQEAAEAPFMTRYTGGKVQSRTATLAVNLMGGGGFEIWQYTSRTSEKPGFQPMLGDLGIFITKIKCPDTEKAHEALSGRARKAGAAAPGPVQTGPDGKKHFFLKDIYGNLFQVVEAEGWFSRIGYPTGGPAGCIIGVSDIEKSREVYSDILGYDTVEYDKTGSFDDLSSLPGGDRKIRRVLLSHSKPRRGAFSKLLGPSRIELVQVLESTGEKPRKIFENRFWGDQGFIHLCFDIQGMQAVRETCEEKGYPFTVDSAESFDMGEASGHFTYIEDPDGTLIEFVETHKLPIVKKRNWYLDLTKRNPEKALPNWMLKFLRFNRKKD